jgi:hypothetical protein
LVQGGLLPCVSEIFIYRFQFFFIFPGKYQMQTDVKITNGGIYMLDLLTQPIVLLGFGMILLGIIIVSVLISKRRSREIEELEQFLPGGELDEIEKIPVEKVRRATKRREQRKQQLQQIPRSPREEVLEIEDLEIVPEELLPPQEEPSTGKEKPQSRPTSVQGVQNRETSTTAMNRQLYKRNILADRKNQEEQLESSPASSMRTASSQMRPNMPGGMQRGITQPRMNQVQNPGRPSAAMRMSQPNMNRPQMNMRPTGSEEKSDDHRPKTPIRRRIQ